MPSAASSPLPVAVPSWVFPGSMAANGAFVRGRVAEMGLCCFETAPSLAPDPDEVAALAALARPAEGGGPAPLALHLHLPADLPWDEGGGATGEVAVAVMKAFAAVRPRFGVLHPPGGEGAAARLEAFARVWREALPMAALLLENTRDQDLLALEPWITASGCGVCLDVGHVLAFGQEALLDRPELMARVALTHWSAPGRGDEHRPLTELTPAQRAVARVAGARTGRARPLIEVFDWAGIEASLPVLFTDCLPVRA